MQMKVRMLLYLHVLILLLTWSQWQWQDCKKQQRWIIIVFKTPLGIKCAKGGGEARLHGCCPRCWSSSPTITSAHFVWGTQPLTAVWQHRQHAQSPPDHFYCGFFSVAGVRTSRVKLFRKRNFSKTAELDWASGWIRGSFRTKLNRLSMSLESWMSLCVRLSGPPPFSTSPATAPAFIARRGGRKWRHPGTN